MYGFVLPVASEGVGQVRWCLGHFRRAFPDAPLVIISDGANDSGYRDLAERFKARYVHGRYLKRVECGGEWWVRTLEAGLALNTSWIVKFDPDTKFHRAFRTPPSGDVAGTIDHIDTPEQNVLGGCQAISRAAAEKILQSKILKDPRLKDYRIYDPSEATLRHWKSQAFFGTDMSLAWVMQNLGLEMGSWSDVGIDWKLPAPVGDFAATHPHKMDVKPKFGDAPLRVIVTCKGRLEHLKQSLPRWVSEPNVAVTVVDYDCPQGTAEWVKANYPMCDVVHVHDRPKFNLSDARNIGAKHASGGWWCFFDADLIAAPGWANAIRAKLKHQHYLMASPIQWNQFGSVVVHSYDFNKAGGYDQLITGWGAEDGDFYSRLRHNGVRPGTFPGGMIGSIPHTDAERTEFYDERDKKRSQALFESYHSSKVAFCLTNNRLPTVDERKALLMDAYEKHNTKPPEWYMDEPKIDVTIGKPISIEPITVAPVSGQITVNVSLPKEVEKALLKLIDRQEAPTTTLGQRANLWTRFLATMRWSPSAVCEASKGCGLIDYHDYHDSTVNEPWHFYTHTCKRCGKQFVI
jgi:hypothetical protein